MTDTADTTTPTRFSFTKPLLKNLPFAEKGQRVFYHDTHEDACGLQLRVTSTSKTFFVQKRVNGRPERVTLGNGRKFPDVTIEQARKAAAKVNATIVDGKSPNAAHGPMRPSAGTEKNHPGPPRSKTPPVPPQAI